MFPLEGEPAGAGFGGDLLPEAEGEGGGFPQMAEDGFPSRAAGVGLGTQGGGQGGDFLLHLGQGGHPGVPGIPHHVRAKDNGIGWQGQVQWGAVPGLEFPPAGGHIDQAALLPQGFLHQLPGGVELVPAHHGEESQEDQGDDQGQGSHPPRPRPPGVPFLPCGGAVAAVLSPALRHGVVSSSGASRASLRCRSSFHFRSWR